MAKSHAAATAFLQKAVSVPTETEKFKESFEVTKPAAMSGFRGMFGEAKLTQREEAQLETLLHVHHEPSLVEEDQIAEDYQTLSRITSEIKAISNQSILLHGERIKKAQDLLRNYKDGAFTGWLLTTYGNRQTPYSMLQYYEFYHMLPSAARGLVENMPKKAAYTLASRTGPLEQKVEIIQSYNGETQRDVIWRIQEAFPCGDEDKRRKPVNEVVLEEIEKLVKKLEGRADRLKEREVKRILLLQERLVQLTRGRYTDSSQSL